MFVCFFITWRSEIYPKQLKKKKERKKKSHMNSVSDRRYRRGSVKGKGLKCCPRVAIFRILLAVKIKTH